MSASLYILAWTFLPGLARWPISSAARDAAGIFLLFFLLAEFPRQRRYARVVFLMLLAIGLLGVARAADPLGLFLAAWRRGASFAAFFLALGMLRDAAETSPLVRRCGQHLVARGGADMSCALTKAMGSRRTGALFTVCLATGVTLVLPPLGLGWIIVQKKHLGSVCPPSVPRPPRSVPPDSWASPWAARSPPAA